MEFAVDRDGPFYAGNAPETYRKNQLSEPLRAALAEIVCNGIALVPDDLSAWFIIHEFQAQYHRGGVVYVRCNPAKAGNRFHSDACSTEYVRALHDVALAWGSTMDIHAVQLMAYAWFNVRRCVTVSTREQRQTIVSQLTDAGYAAESEKVTERYGSFYRICISASHFSIQ